MAKNIKVALVHDYLQEFGGAERVVLAMHHAFPQAPLYVGFADLESLGEQGTEFAQMSVRTTWLQKMPGIKKLRSPARILAPQAFASLDLSEFDVVISSTNAYHAKAVKVRPDAIHLCYCHTPARSLYGFETQSGWQQNPWTHTLGEIANHWLRLRDFEDAQAVTEILANSETVAKRIAKFWRRESTILNPPVVMIDQTEKRKLIPNDKRSYFLYVNRLHLTKHPEIAVQAAIKKHWPLKIIGSGPMDEVLQKMIVEAGQNETIQLLGKVSDEELMELYSNALALLYPVSDEDFGIVPVEAMALGTPVIAHRSGGPAETIIEDKNGVFFDELKVESLISAAEKWEQIDWQPAVIRQSVKKFSEKCFVKQLQDLVQKSYKKSHAK